MNMKNSTRSDIKRRPKFDRLSKLFVKRKADQTHQDWVTSHDFDGMVTILPRNRK